eukprot:8367665-Alexandrium_andersonii.AAC.1
MPEQFTLGNRRRGSKNWQALDRAVKAARHGARCNRARRWLPGGHLSVERPHELVHLAVRELTPARETAVATQARRRLPAGRGFMPLNGGCRYR